MVVGEELFEDERVVVRVEVPGEEVETDPSALSLLESGEHGLHHLGPHRRKRLLHPFYQFHEVNSALVLHVQVVETDLQFLRAEFQILLFQPLCQVRKANQVLPTFLELLQLLKQFQSLVQVLQRFFVLQLQSQVLNKLLQSNFYYSYSSSAFCGDYWHTGALKLKFYLMIKFLF